MRGSGMVRDLRPAMSLGNAQALDLQAKLSQFAAGTTRDQQMAHLDALVQAWGATSSMTTSAANITPGSSVVNTSTTAIGQFASSHPTQYAQLIALEQFNGQTILEKWIRPIGPTWAALGFEVSYSTAQEVLVGQAYDALKQSVYGAMVVQTRLKPYLDRIELVVDATGIRFDTTALSALLESRKVTDERNALLDLVDLGHSASPTLLAVGFIPTQRLRVWVDALPAASPLRAELASVDVYTGYPFSSTDINFLISPACPPRSGR